MLISAAAFEKTVSTTTTTTTTTNDDDDDEEENDNDNNADEDYEVTWPRVLIVCTTTDVLIERCFMRSAAETQTQTTGASIDVSEPTETKSFMFALTPINKSLTIDQIRCVARSQLRQRAALEDEARADGVAGRRRGDGRRLLSCGVGLASSVSCGVGIVVYRCRFSCLL
jgi:hypothetical protein